MNKNTAQTKPKENYHYTDEELFELSPTFRKTAITIRSIQWGKAISPGFGLLPKIITDTPFSFKSDDPKERKNEIRAKLESRFQIEVIDLQWEDTYITVLGKIEPEFLPVGTKISWRNVLGLGRKATIVAPNTNAGEEGPIALVDNPKNIPSLSNLRLPVSEIKQEIIIH